MQYYFPNYPDISLDRTIAVDFGTTNTTVFVVHNNKAEAIQIDGQLSMLRSVVSYGNNNVLVGNAADKTRNFTLKVYNIKRIAGLNYDEINFDGVTFGCEVIELFGQLAVKGTSRASDITKTVEEVITDIFMYIKHTVENKYGTEFNYLVLTVPSTYRSTQKKVIRSAAIKAGFEVASMLSEPTAAGIHYRYINFVSNSSVFLVFDFGGGTLDLSLVSCTGNKFEVLANGGSSHLGGADVDNAILRWIEDCYTQDGHDRLHLNSREMRALKQTIEQKKQELSDKEMVEIEVTEDCDPYKLSRAELADIISNITNEIVTCLDKLGAYVLEHYEGKRIGDHLVSDMDAPSDILPTLVSSVLLVGGSSKLLAVQEKLETVFDKSIIHMDSDSQLCVGMGAMESLMFISRDNQIHECLYNEFVILVNQCVVGKVPRGTTIPFDVSYTLGARKRGADVEVVVKQIMEEEGREEVVLQYTNAFFQDVARLYLSLKIDIQYDGLLTVRVRDEMSGLEEIIGKVEYCSVCYKHRYTMESKLYK